MNETIDMVTPEEVERSYNAAMDSVNLLNAGKPEQMTEADWEDTVARNKAHLEIQIAKGDYYAGYDMKPFEDAVKGQSATYLAGILGERYGKK